MSNRSRWPGEGPPAWAIVLALVLGCLVAFGVAWMMGEPGSPASRRREPWTLDRLQDALLRCQALGDGALGDARCRAAWAEHRRHFLDGRYTAEPRQ